MKRHPFAIFGLFHVCVLSALNPACALNYGPSFECSRAANALQLVICGSPDLRRLDIEVLQPYYVLRHAQPQQLDELRRQANNLTASVIQRCELTQGGRSEGDRLDVARACVAALYRSRRQEWLDDVRRLASRSAVEEVERPLSEHIALQEQLQLRGYLQGSIDGVYGTQTRAAIQNYQRDRNLAADGFMGASTAHALTSGAASTNISTIDTIETFNNESGEIFWVLGGFLFMTWLVSLIFHKAAMDTRSKILSFFYKIFAKLFGVPTLIIRVPLSWLFAHVRGRPKPERAQGDKLPPNALSDGRSSRAETETSASFSPGNQTQAPLEVHGSPKDSEAQRSPSQSEPMARHQTNHTESYKTSRSNIENSDREKENMPPKTASRYTFEIGNRYASDVGDQKTEIVSTGVATTLFCNFLSYKGLYDPEEIDLEKNEDGSGLRMQINIIINEGKNEVHLNISAQDGKNIELGIYKYDRLKVVDFDGSIDYLKAEFDRADLSSFDMRMRFTDDPTDLNNFSCRASGRKLLCLDRSILFEYDKDLSSMVERDFDHLNESIDKILREFVEKGIAFLDGLPPKYFSQSEVCSVRSGAAQTQAAPASGKRRSKPASAARTVPGKAIKPAGGTLAVFQINLGKTYYRTGYINPGPVASLHLGEHDEPVTVILGNGGVRVRSRIDRQANANGSVRVIGKNADIAYWFQQHFNQGDTVNAIVQDRNTIQLINK